jgi:hypothetical protein
MSNSGVVVLCLIDFEPFQLLQFELQLLCSTAKIGELFLEVVTRLVRVVASFLLAGGGPGWCRLGTGRARER